MADWTPLNLANGAASWIDFSDGSTRTLDGSSLIEAAADKARAGAASQPTASLRPAVGAINGVEAADFSSDRMSLTSVAGIRAVFFVSGGLSGSSITTVSPIVSGGDDHVFVRTDDATYTISIDGNAGALGSASVDGGAVTAGTNIDLGISNTAKAAPRLFYVEWEAAATIDEVGSLNEYDLDGAIGEIVLLDYVPAEADRQSLEGYLAWKWGLESSLPAAHPYKLAPPEGESVTGGGQITGTVTVGGSPAVRQIIGITYQPQTITPAEGDPYEARQIVGETVSAEDGTYTLATGSFLDETIVLALEDYGTVWKPNRTLEVGDRIRPTQPNQNGYVYQVTIAGNSGTEEPEWIIPTGAVTTMDVGTATVQGFPLFWSLAHAPILPESTGPAAPEITGPVDEHFASVALLLHFDGPPGSTQLPDSGPGDVGVYINAYGLTNNTHQIVDTSPKFGAGCLEDLNAYSPGWVEFPVSVVDLSADFTYEFWYLKTGSTADILLSTQVASGDPGLVIKTTQYNNGRIYADLYDDTGLRVSRLDTGRVIANDVWYHVAVVREGANFRLFLDGVQSAVETISGSFTTPASGIGKILNGSLARLDDLRITNGVARYTSDFTPPDAPHPDQ